MDKCIFNIGSKMKSIICLFIITIIIAGCANAPRMSSKEKNINYSQYAVANNLTSLDKIRSFRYQGWQSLTDNYLIISTSFKKKYLIEVNGFCSNLAFSHTIMINQSTSSILSKNFDSISTLESPRQKCFIKSIYQINKEQATEISKIGQSE